ncbi:putative cathepsin B2 cysteine protease [Monocercomonoides exilis]|uniref:putative cathepsin B2 cysteine protease n=1 Tax=Monocercomonoides exilis TaxID=2049356 RepID=UPI00355AC864|nr:putative cathepsin B2 cysteine protease [Monocercomonoides exilis]|eukprot:MONOS_8591.1-p1 / transcript=MONOS_8591.1 / gene=MONOS_8591 / organism=Monocercomonoides_exilis_PA203 / gene_product=cathepsin B2 cysteine protease / transcript_product=cathepsin B2 cysteine protease / location=Mono_scaffold00327:44910-45767(+) / protein_length=285 / sequence_SO=supercontig / SO=protein_coding / is_pseudo=false
MFFAICLISWTFSETMVELINSDPSSTWIAYDYPPEIMTAEKLKRRVGVHLPHRETRIWSAIPEVPEEFDSRSYWQGKILGVRDQGDCGSCWAFAISECVGDRINIIGRGRGHMSPQDLVSCDKDDMGCDGSTLDPAWQWIFTDGITNEDCMPYVSGTGRVPQCPKRCINGSTIIRTRANSWRYLHDDEMQKEIYEHGPIQVAFTVYDDFRTYKSGVYKHKYGSACGGHAVLCLGWGVENGTPYWLCQNSWGSSWGDEGLFKILRGDNHCGIESYAFCGVFGNPK